MKGRDGVDDQILVSTGKILKEYLNEYGINQKELSARIGVSEKHISNVINGNCRLTEEFALKIEKVLVDIPASYWLNYEAKYREYLARNEEFIKIRKWDLREISKKFHFNEVFKGLDITLDEQAIAMLKLLKISDFSNFTSTYENLTVDFMEDGGEKEAIAVWLNLCESEIEIQNDILDDIFYEKQNLEKFLEKFKLLSNNDETELSLQSCRKLCNKLGIYLVQCEAVTNSKVRGALTTYRDHPAIYLSGRFKTHDHIWFAFVHEIAHLLMHYNKKEIIISYEDENEDIREVEANNFARDFFINPKDYNRFVSSKIFTKTSISKFARTQNTLPIIVVARLKHDGNIKYNQFVYMK